MSFFRSISAGLAFLTSASSFANFRVEQLATDPTTNIDKPGRIWYNTTEKTYKVTVLHHQSGSVVIEAAPTRTEITNIINTAQANTDAISALQTADTAINNTIGALGTTYLKLDGTGQMAGALNVGGNRVVAVGDASATTDGVNKGQVTQAIATATSDLVSISAMNTAINAALAQHVTGVLQFAGDVYTYTASGAISVDNPTDITQWVGVGKTAGSAFRVKPMAGQYTCFFQYGSSNVVEAKVGDLLVVGPSGELIVDDNTQAPVANASSYVTVSGDNSTGYNVDVSAEVKTATDKAVYTDGTRAMTAALNMGGHVIDGLLNAVTNGEATNKGQVDQAFDALASKISTKMGGAVIKYFHNVTGGTVSFDARNGFGGWTDFGYWHATENEYLPAVTATVYARPMKPDGGSGAPWEVAQVWTEVAMYNTPGGNQYGQVGQFQFQSDVPNQDYVVVLEPSRPLVQTDFLVTA